MMKATRLPILLLLTFRQSLLSVVLPAILSSNILMPTMTTRYGTRKNVNVEGVTMAPAMDAARTALRKSESTIKAQKTKNLSNKHKERMSIASAMQSQS